MLSLGSPKSAAGAFYCNAFHESDAGVAAVRSSYVPHHARIEFCVSLSQHLK
jgi:hypothetical protein